MKKPEVTVLIPFYNRRSYLPQSIQSVFDQTIENWRLILIDDASTDDYLPGIQKFLKDTRVSLLKNKKNQGQSKSLNYGLEFVKTPFIVQLDSDDLFFPNSLEVLLQEAKKQPEEVGLICGNMRIIVENQFGKVTKTLLKKGRSFDNPYDFLLANTSLCPRMYRTSALHSIGGWPTDDPYGGRYREDMRTLYRLIEKYKFHWIDEELYIMREHKKNHTNQVKKYVEMMEWSIRNALKRLGDEYEPVFEKKEGGWMKLAYLKPKSQEVKERGGSY